MAWPIPQGGITKRQKYINKCCLFAQGLYPESHGIVDNEFYDPEFGEMFNYGGRNDSDNRWWLGEPVR